MTLIIESPIVIKDSVNVAFLNSRESPGSTNKDQEITFNMTIYGEINKTDIKTREIVPRSPGKWFTKKVKKI